MVYINLLITLVTWRLRSPVKVKVKKYAQCGSFCRCLACFGPFLQRPGPFSNVLVSLVRSRLLCNQSNLEVSKKPGGCKKDLEVEKGTLTLTWRLEPKSPKTKVDAAYKYGYVITSALLLVT